MIHHLLIALSLLVISIHSQMCVVPNTSNLPFCKNYFRTTGYKLYDELYSSEDQRGKDNLAKSRFQDPKFFNSTQATSECKVIVADMLCSIIFPRCRNYPAEFAVLPCEKSCIALLEQCSDSYLDKERLITGCFEFDEGCYNLENNYTSGSSRKQGLSSIFMVVCLLCTAILLII